MKQFLGWMLVGGAIAAPVQAEQPLFLAYPPPNHETTADQIFLIGTAAAGGEVEVNGQVIQRSEAGHFAPSFPLEMGENRFTLRYGSQELTTVVTRLPSQPPAPQGLAFGEGSLRPNGAIARLPGEPICFGAIAPPQTQVSVLLNGQVIPLQAQGQQTSLPSNLSVLTQQNQPQTAGDRGVFQGCSTFSTPGVLGTPEFQLSLGGQTHREMGAGPVEILSPANLAVVAVTTEEAIARTGPASDYSRLTPLPKGSQAAVTGQEGDWLRLDYGAWLRQSETEPLRGTSAIRTTSGDPARSIIRSARSRSVPGWTEIVFPLEVPVPVSVQQGDDFLTLSLYNTTAQTDIIRLDDDPIIDRLDWQQVSPSRIDYRFQLKSEQQWGHKLRYEGSSLVLSLRHPPARPNRRRPLEGVTVLLDPGHGSENDLGARGPTGYPEKDVALRVSQQVRDRLEARGAKVVMTREGDDDLYPQDRVDVINQQEPTLALSLHYNALPDNGDAENTQGLAAFWYHPQAHSLAVFLHNYLTETLDRPSYGVFWNNLALTRPAVAPAVMLELGFMIHPEEYEWIVDSEAQEDLAEAIAEGVSQWVSQTTRQP